MDRNFETGQAEAEDHASETAGEQPTVHQGVARVDLDFSVAMMFGHKNVRWDGATPYVKTEPLPNR